PLYYPTLHLFFLNHPATTSIYTLSLHDALPISRKRADGPRFARTQNLRPVETPGSRYADEAFALLEQVGMAADAKRACGVLAYGDRKSTRLNSSHVAISYAVFCLKKKKECTDVT